LTPGQLVNGLLDLNEATGLTHGHGREVGVSSSPVPITLINPGYDNLKKVATFIVDHKNK
jgi:hypothetical protein